MNVNHEKERGSSVEKIMQGLILIAICWVGATLTMQNKDIGVLRSQVDHMQKSMDGPPDLNSRVTTLETNQVELLRRQNADEQRWERLNNSRMKEWTR